MNLSNAVKRSVSVFLYRLIKSGCVKLLLLKVVLAATELWDVLDFSKTLFFTGLYDVVMFMVHFFEHAILHWE